MEPGHGQPGGGKDHSLLCRRVPPAAQGGAGKLECGDLEAISQMGRHPHRNYTECEDLLASREVENIFENSDFVYLLNQASGDRKILSSALNISPSQQNYITNSNAGEGLIFYGSTIVPFKDNFPKDTMLYRIMTTKPEETLQN